MNQQLHFPKPNYIIREFNFDTDLDDCLKIWNNSGGGIHLSKSDTPDEIKKYLAKASGLFIVAESNDGRLIGTALGGFYGRRGMMYHLAVDPSHRNLGIASHLVKELEKRLKQYGCIRCYLLVTPDNSSAIDFYEKRGWQRLELAIYGKDLEDD